MQQKHWQFFDIVFQRHHKEDIYTGKYVSKIKEDAAATSKDDDTKKKNLVHLIMSVILQSAELIPDPLELDCSVARCFMQVEAKSGSTNRAKHSVIMIR